MSDHENTPPLGTVASALKSADATGVSTHDELSVWATHVQPTNFLIDLTVLNIQ
jgi:hypothetical protein